MGYKCPICHKNYGQKKKNFDRHLKLAHNGYGLALKQTVGMIYDKTAFAKCLKIFTDKLKEVI